MTPFEMAFWLLASHAVCDYALQNQFVADAKNRHTPVGGLFWMWVLPSHGIIHGAGVALVTGSVWLGVAETVAHTVIDHLKCDKRFGIHVDQWMHVACKGVWLVLAQIGA